MKKFSFNVSNRDGSKGGFGSSFEGVNAAISHARLDMINDNEINSIEITGEDVKSVTLSRRSLTEKETINFSFDIYKEKMKGEQDEFIAFTAGWKAEKNNNIDIIEES